MGLLGTVDSVNRTHLVLASGKLVLQKLEYYQALRPTPVPSDL